MIEIAVWMVAIAISIFVLIISAAGGMVTTHTTIACVVALCFAAYAVIDNRRLHEAKASEYQVAASTARHMGLVWAWGALGLLMTYMPSLKILLWKEWLTFTGMFAGLAVLCLFMAATIASDEQKGRQDRSLLNVAHYLSVTQLIGMIIAMVGLVVDKKFPPVVKKSIEWQDWAANTYFFFGAAALAIISANALISARKRSAA
ncbi:MAG: hypothetical protein NW217_05225 [Hyphomicrobiaceae bacterium]|nr:hypothetical protein [Hyphomicrobiaceae bacterium]